MQANGGTFSDEPQSNSNKITIDNSILSNIINRLDSLEKKQLNAGSNSNSAVAENGNSEKITKLEKELRDTKDLLMSFIMKCDVLTRETGQRFTEIEAAISSIEGFIQPNAEDSVISTLDVSQEIVSDVLVENVDETNE